ncbi:MAG TPA: hypothetical protein VEL76_17180 [Gemmataceae bacterium]|nr:hypothetical protein [Gemmataceae bacterium]
MLRRFDAGALVMLANGRREPNAVDLELADKTRVRRAARRQPAGGSELPAG